MVEDLLVLQTEIVVTPARQSRRSSWERPSHAFQASSAIGASGAVIRDADGKLIAASANRYTHVADALTGEFLAARGGLKLAAQQRLDRVILECDNLSLINMLREGNGDRSAVFGLWQEIQELGRSFVSLDFLLFTGKGQNGHCLPAAACLQWNLSILNIVRSCCFDDGIWKGSSCRRKWAATAIQRK
ncbi:hypothetical protein C2845_PM13G03860 [Panicum miliaceum]|uniref:RNase H type-1 domain-containing protein n=1 Tax=Panicum miliaceum TaxID=4540 RepID=A0A3L6REP0_PANMI|nr:hypothetical protein C2845_PM13G03860 [Panicum miliaceum]